MCGQIPGTSSILLLYKENRGIVTKFNVNERGLALYIELHERGLAHNLDVTERGLV